jgi:hypothetical protein
MRIMILMACLLLSAPLRAQKADQPFTGALEMGLGWGVPIDFTLDNNILTGKYLGYRLLEIPWQAGFHASKSFNAETCLELGLIFHRRSSSWASGTEYTQGNVTLHSDEHHVLAMNCIDFSLKYYKYLTSAKNREMYVFGGIAPVWIINVPYSSDLANNSIPAHCFRNWNMAVAGGVTLENGNIRWKLHFDFALVSVVNSEYAREVPEEERAWGAKIHPFEVLLCCAYRIR